MKIFRSLLLGVVAATVLGGISACGGGSGGSGPFFVYVEDGVTIVKRPLSGGVGTPIIVSLNVLSNLRLSPDQSQILYIDNNNLFVANVNGTGVLQLTGYKYGDWSADGTKIFAVGTDNKIRSMNPDGTGVSADIFDGSAGSGILGIDVAPTGNTMVVTYGPSGWLRLLSMDTAGGNQNFLTANGIHSSDARFNATSTKLVFLGSPGVYTVNADGTGLTGIVTTGTSINSVVYRADGTLLYSYVIGNGIWSMTDTGGSMAVFFDQVGVGESGPDVID
ncbi:MAG: hypothetical protein KF824_05130 [Fimbriimonadaceae bacterium]|nr:MAG: hypothetical protein KF824_05130 [Fimbriimonadaceae bacterium]